MVVHTGTVPERRAHLYFKLDGAVTRERLEAANTALCKLLGSDSVQDAPRVMRLAGTVNYPSPKKQERGYVAELTTLRPNPGAPAYRADELIGLNGGSTDGLDEYAEEPGPGGRSDAEVMALLEASRVKNWHDNM